ncbi:nuclear receptor coactivator 7-like isoform X7 [Pristis pectinata]|uniref:nuclear receptor coactivator 7-like isoform X7 n=1 Tax=Pristis pectinata TaxID=685728 RepID=UPI00223E1FA3|nr:nuclear receptor coactivator 7-like isoform X7 [Pristis pectinata]
MRAWCGCAKTAVACLCSFELQLRYTFKMGLGYSVREVDHLYAFFVQWSPEVYGKDAKDQGFVVVEKDELEVIDNFFSDPVPKSWEIITIEEAKRRQSISSLYEEEIEDLQPVLTDPSELLESFHIEKLMLHLPARTQGYAWRLMYSTAVHGTSLRTLYRSLAVIDAPVLLVVKDMDNQIFGALASHPFRLSDHCFGTGETFLYTFNPQFKIFRWSGENSYFIKGDKDSLELGGGSGHFGLWLDADLYHGRSNPCSTFNNETLSKKEDFIVQDLEVWTFV